MPHLETPLPKCYRKSLERLVDIWLLFAENQILMKMYLIKNKWFRTCVKYSHWMMEFRDEAINVILNQTLISKIQVGNLNSTNQTIHTSEPLSLHLCKYNYSFNIHVVRHVFNLSASNYRQKKSLIVIVRIS